MRKDYDKAAAFKWNEFAIVHFRADKNKKIPQLVHEWAKLHIHIPMEACARQVWAGTTDHFHNFPAGDTAWDFRLLNGARAYAYVLQVVTGLHSPDVGEDHIVHQYNVKWNEFKAKHEEFELAMRPVKEAFDEDNRLVRKEVVDHLIRPYDVHTIKLLSGHKNGQSMLISTYLTKDGSIEGDGAKMAGFFGNNRNGRPLVSEIGIVGTTLDEARAIVRILKGLQEQRKIHRDIVIHAVAGNEMTAACEHYDHVVLTSPMGRTTKLEVEIISAWESRARRDNTLTCTRGSSELADDMTPLWKNADLDNFISPALIKATIGRINTYNSHLVEIAHQAIDICADSRVLNVPLRRTGMKEEIKQDLRPVSIFEKPVAARTETIRFGSLTLAVA